MEKERLINVGEDKFGGSTYIKEYFNLKGHFFDMCGIKITSYVVTKKRERDNTDFYYRKLPVVEFESIKNDPNGG